MSRAHSWMLTALLAGLMACHDEPTAPPSTGGSDAVEAAVNVSLLFLQVSTGSFKACGVTTEHRAYCWRVGEWKPGDEPFVAYPVPGAISFQQVNVGKSDDHFCGISTTNLAYCWGNNDLGQLGDGTFRNSATPVRVAGGRRFLSITAGYKFTCARNLPSRALCWGDNTYGEIGNGNSGNPPTPELVTTADSFQVLNAGLEHICGVTTRGRASCWGRAEELQLGDGTPAHRSDSVPTPVAGTRLYKQIDAGVDHSCALALSGAAFCWGSSPGLGDGTSQDRAVPTRVVGGLTFAQLSTGWSHTCAVTVDRRAYCWGAFITGQINGGGPSSSTVPVAVATTYPFTQISTGEHLTCAIRPSGLTMCWGLGWGQDGRMHQIHAVR